MNVDGRSKCIVSLRRIRKKLKLLVPGNTRAGEDISSTCTCTPVVVISVVLLAVRRRVRAAVFTLWAVILRTSGLQSAMSFRALIPLVLGFLLTLFTPSTHNYSVFV
jgi:uncharacterized membrane protein YdfJ with MMPL/SSD domain